MTSDLIARLRSNKFSTFELAPLLHEAADALETTQAE